jgi:hypothetical protein
MASPCRWPMRSSTLAVCLALAVLAVRCTGGSKGSGSSTGPSPVLTLSVAPATVTAGGSAQGTVGVAGSAPSSPTAVNLASSSPSVTVQGTVTIPANASQATFTATTSASAASGTATLTATIAGTSTSAMATLTIAARVTEADVPICGPWPGPVPLPFHVYADAADRLTHFIPSGFIGDSADLRVNLADSNNPRVGASSMRIEYTPRGGQRFAGIYFQCPENNFGTVAGAGFNLTQARRLTFWARASAPGKAEFKVGGIGRGNPPAPFPDSFGPVETSPIVVDLGTDWRQFTIDLTGRDLSRVIGGFLFVTNSTSQNSNGLTLFLDEIVFE